MDVNQHAFAKTESGKVQYGSSGPLGAANKTLDSWCISTYTLPLPSLPVLLSFGRKLGAASHSWSSKSWGRY